MIKSVFPKSKIRQAGFSLIELLVVVAILGALAAVAVPNIGKFINKGKTEAYATELHNIQLAVMAMLNESTTGELVPANDISILSQVVTTDVPPLKLSDYLIPLDIDLSSRSKCTYDFTFDGRVTQHLP
ncbi:MAG TPA: type II secretion system protein [Dehalococcoidales bacterium]|nr:type II secretion system protein [Dehalococcoidales bacterium]